MVSYKEAREFKEEWEKGYLCPGGRHYKTYEPYICGCGITTLWSMKQRIPDFKLGSGESLNDICLHILLKQDLPEDLKFPKAEKTKDGKEIKLFCDVVGAPRLL